MSTGIFLFMLGMCGTVMGVAGIEGSIPLWQGFLFSFAGIITMFVSILYMSKYEPENILDGDDSENF